MKVLLVIAFSWLSATGEMKLMQQGYTVDSELECHQSAVTVMKAQWAAITLIGGTQTYTVYECFPMPRDTI